VIKGKQKKIYRKQHWQSLLFRFFLIVILKMTVIPYIFGQSYPPIIFDKQQSEYFGAYNLITLQKSAYTFQEKYIPDSLFIEGNPLRKTLGISYRLGKLFLLDFQQDFLIALVQHEAFGHGARYREFGFERNSYHFSPFFPFGNGSGFAHSGLLKPGEIMTPQESITNIFSGNEANLILSNTLSSQFLLDDTIHYRQALLYLITQNNQLEYIWLTRLSKTNFPTFGSGDIKSYIDGLNWFYGTGSTKKYSINQISMQSLISIANPMQLYSIYTVFFQYALKGKKHLNNIPMFKIKNAEYLPLFNYNLTPFGSEYQFSNIIKHRQRLYNVDLSIGDNTFNKFYGATFKIFNVIDNQKVGINIYGSVWNQPELELQNPFIKNKTNKTGACLKTDIMYRPFKHKNKLGIFLQTAYKSKGYLMGEPLAETFIVRYGFSLHY